MQRMGLIMTWRSDWHDGLSINCTGPTLDQNRNVWLFCFDDCYE